jgi:ATP-dependent DNA ligase
VPRNRFIEPSAPVLRPEPPIGPEWLHEVKHDGWRERRYMLRRPLKRADKDALRLSETFDDPLALLKACQKHGLEGIVSKRRCDPYRPGSKSGWIKVKTAA